MKKKSRLDELVLKNGLAKDIKEAQALIMAGLIICDKTTNLKPGTLIPDVSNIDLVKTNPYVSRGGLKLESALNNLSICVEGKTCLDIGASTGGFTDCLLKHGALKVYALDVGENLMDSRLKADPRVISMENVNFRYFSNGSLKETVQFVTIDLSFISLKNILPAVPSCLSKGGEVLAMVKPQFEAVPSDAPKGVVRDEALRLRYIKDVKDFAVVLGFQILGSVDSDTKGPKGNIEHFLYMALNK